MAFNIHWKILFKSLRAGTVYTVNIWKDGTLPSGYPLTLKGAAEPMTTDEDADEDMFCPVRKQSGYFRIVDDGRATNASYQEVDFDWKEMLPVNDTDRPVTLTAGIGNVVWQGFMQAQNFGSELYGNPQSHEFPVQCCLSLLSAIKVSTSINELKNFAFLIDHMISQIPCCQITSVVVQGGSDARTWLLKKFDWQNFLNNDDDEAESDYNLGQVLEDFAKFWGWTARTMGQTLYLTCADDTTERSFLTLTRQQLATLASGTSAGTVTSSMPSTTFSGDIFASTDNDDYLNRGPQRAVVKVDANRETSVIKCFPKSVEDHLESLGYGSWVQGEDDMTGYFSTPEIKSFDARTLKGTAGTYGGFCRRQIYPSTDATSPSICDMISITGPMQATPHVQLQTKKAMTLSGGSLSLKGTVYVGEKTWDEDQFNFQLKLRIGIGPNADRSGAKWWYMENSQVNISKGWSSTVREFWAAFNGAQIQTTSCRTGGGFDFILLKFPRIPIEDGLNGFIFVDIFGIKDTYTTAQEEYYPCQIANVEIEFTRDKTILPTHYLEIRQRELVTERNTTKEYKASNNNQTQGEWNADCIFASDNNLAYGYGLLLNPDGTYMETAPYGQTSDHPEQHLADRVAAYWAQAKRRIGTEVRSNAVPSFDPTHKIVMASTTFSPISISHSWRDDVTKLTLLEIPA